MLKLSDSLHSVLLISLIWQVCLATNYLGKRQVYTQFAPPSAEKIFSSRQLAAAPPLTTVPIAAQQYGALPASQYGALPASQYGALPASQYGLVYNTIPAQQHAFRQQYQYVPAPFVQSPYQILYPQNAGLNGPGPIIYLNRVPAADGTTPTTPAEQGPSGVFGQYIPSNWPSLFGSSNSWPSFPSLSQYIPSGFGTGSGTSEAEATTPSSSAEGGSQNSAGISNANKNKPEKLESGNTESQNLESVKLESEKIIAEAEPFLQSQQTPSSSYPVPGYPQFFGHFAAFPSDKEPTALTAATKGAISSFLFYKDQPQYQQQQQLLQAQQQPFLQQPFVQQSFLQQPFVQQQQQFPQVQQVQQQQQPQQQITQKSAVPSEVQNNVGSAQVAYQRYLLLSKQRSDDILKSGSTGGSADAVNSASSSTSSQQQQQQQQKEVQQQQQSSNAIGVESSAQSKSSSAGTIAEASPTAIAHAGIGGIAGASPYAAAISGLGGVSSSAPKATAIAGTSKEPTFTLVPIKKPDAPIPKYSSFRYKN